MPAPKQNFQISSEQMCSIMQKQNRNLRDELRAIAKSKGLTEHALVEIYLERAVKQYKTKGF